MFLWEGRTVWHNGNKVIVLDVIKATKQAIVQDASNPKKSYLVNIDELDYGFILWLLRGLC